MISFVLLHDNRGEVQNLIGAPFLVAFKYTDRLGDVYDVVTINNKSPEVHR